MIDVTSAARKRQSAIMRSGMIAQWLNRLKDHHEETHLHCLRVGLLSLKLGLSRGLSARNMDILGVAAHLHDVGKLSVKPDILRKNGTLTDAQKLQVQDHVRNGHVLLKDHLPAVAELVARHHEYQLVPYPRQKGQRRRRSSNTDRRQHRPEMIHMAQIIAVADITDALLSCRAYKDALPPDEVAAILCREFTGDPSLIHAAIEHAVAV